MRILQGIYLITGLLLATVFLGCNSEDANDCFQTAGTIVQEERPATDFSRILVNEGITMVIKQAPEYKVVVESGENLMNDIHTEVKDGQLILTNNNICNYVRKYEFTTIFVAAPDIAEIRSATQREIRSEGTITTDKLTVYSENYQNNEYLTSAAIYLNVDVNQFQIVFNGISNIYMTGKAKSLNINMASGNGRFEGRNFPVENATVYHRSSNDVIVKASTLLKGDIYSTGDIISVGIPQTVEIVEHYKGKLIYEE
ncbi:head GIN domain-containing protein [Galbibacter sp. PAP.153]|uniref:head GIN domain-containing protein n=1 Tax=Galbibacter sp. PAP.153 TaxID=3104623 RepID=UPI00300B4D78